MSSTSIAVLQPAAADAKKFTSVDPNTSFVLANARVVFAEPARQARYGLTSNELDGLIARRRRTRDTFLLDNATSLDRLASVAPYFDNLQIIRWS